MDNKTMANTKELFKAINKKYPGKFRYNAKSGIITQKKEDDKFTDRLFMKFSTIKQWMEFLCIDFKIVVHVENFFGFYGFCFEID